MRDGSGVYYINIAFINPNTTAAHDGTVNGTEIPDYRPYRFGSVIQGIACSTGQAAAVSRINTECVRNSSKSHFLANARCEMVMVMTGSRS